MRIAIPIAGAAVNRMVVGVERVNAVVSTPLSETLMCVVSRYEKVKGKVVMTPFPV
jgi:hypothetical protein